MIMFCYLFEFMYSCHTSVSHQYIKISYPCALTDNSQERKKLYYKLIKHKKYHCISIYGDMKDDTDENGNEYKKYRNCKIQ